jgi:hypothetical protein
LDSKIIVQQAQNIFNGVNKMTKIYLLFFILTVNLFAQGNLSYIGTDRDIEFSEIRLYEIRLDTHIKTWGSLGINKAVIPPGSNRESHKININGVLYDRGLGVNSNSMICVALDGKYSAFETEFGFQKSQDKKGSVVCQVYVDNEKKFDSGIIKRSDPPLKIRIDVTNARELRLSVRDAGDGILGDAVNWANARLLADSPFKDKTLINSEFVCQPVHG